MAKRLAILVALLVALKSSVALAHAPAEPDYAPSGTACADVPRRWFQDVPITHPSVRAIDCIAHYEITKGTSPTTFSPSAPVTREHTAIFLMRLARSVEIASTPDPQDFGFTDIGGLPEGSQVAINQLAALGITKGTSPTTYSPSDGVTRGQMAVFIARLMDLMEPRADGGYTPSDVRAGPDSPMAPYTDLGSTTREVFDAIVELYELGVISGVSPTTYDPQALITRAAMADSMVGVLAHSTAATFLSTTTAAGYGDLPPPEGWEEPGPIVEGRIDQSAWLDFTYIEENPFWWIGWQGCRFWVSGHDQIADVSNWAYTTMMEQFFGFPTGTEPEAGDSYPPLPRVVADPDLQIRSGPPVGWGDVMDRPWPATASYNWPASGSWTYRVPYPWDSHDCDIGDTDFPVLVIIHEVAHLRPWWHRCEEIEPEWYEAHQYGGRDHCFTFQRLENWLLWNYVKDVVIGKENCTIPRKDPPGWSGASSESLEFGWNPFLCRFHHWENWEPPNDFFRALRGEQ